MPNPKPTPDNPEQSQRFIDMAREVGADENPEAFERALEKVTNVANIKSHQPSSPAPDPKKP